MQRSSEIIDVLLKDEIAVSNDSLSHDLLRLKARFAEQAGRVVGSPRQLRTVEEIIDNAFEQGARRSPRETDIIVHPEFPFDSGSPGLRSALARNGLRSHMVDTIIGDLKDEFARDITRVLSTAPNSVVIAYLGSRQFCDFPYTSAQNVLSWHPSSGMISRTEFPKFLSLLGGLNPNDRFRIHGANFGQCTSRAVQQLYAALHFGGFYGPDYDGVWTGTDRSAFDVIFEHEPFFFDQTLTSFDLLKNSSLRLGYVFDGAGLLSSGDYDHGDAQLIDHQTKIYPNFPHPSIVPAVPPQSMGMRP
ncbi:MAG: hypothetical protein AAB551_00870 [Patescibacteria group bacterium]